MDCNQVFKRKTLKVTFLVKFLQNCGTSVSFKKIFLLPKNAFKINGSSIVQIKNCHYPTQVIGDRLKTLLRVNPVCSLLLIAQHHLSSWPLEIKLKIPEKGWPLESETSEKGWPLASREQIRLRLHTGSRCRWIICAIFIILQLVSSNFHV